MSLDNPAFWVAISFLGFVALLVYLKVPGMLGRTLDDRADAIKLELDQARRLRDEAAKLLEDFKGKHRAAEGEAKAIVDQARRDAEEIAAESRRTLAETVERRTKQAEEKIARAETQAVADVRAAAVEAAVTAAGKILAGQTANNGALVDGAIKDLKGRLN